MAMTIVEETRLLTGGVDTHRDNHVAAVVDANGGVIAVESFPATGAGYKSLTTWILGQGRVETVGVEGTGSYGAGLARHLRGAGLAVVEVDRVNRQARRRNGKSDPLDAVEAARAAASGRCRGVAKTADGNVEALRVLMVARRSAREARAKALVQIRHLSFTSPDPIRDQFRGIQARQVAAIAASLRPSGDVVNHATKTSLRMLGRRVQTLDVELAAIELRLTDLVEQTAPDLLALHGVGPVIAATLLVAVGDNPHRMRSEAAFAHLCGVAPIPAMSGQVTGRVRLNRGGNRHANGALWRIVFSRMHNDERTRAYVERRRGEGKTRKEIMRCLQRYVARDIYRVVAT
jgi:transposase